MTRMTYRTRKQHWTVALQESQQRLNHGTRERRRWVSGIGMPSNGVLHCSHGQAALHGRPLAEWNASLNESITGYYGQAPERARHKLRCHLPRAAISITAGVQFAFARQSRLRLAGSDRLTDTADPTQYPTNGSGTVKGQFTERPATANRALDAQRSKVLCLFQKLTRTPTCCVNATTQVGHRNQSELSAVFGYSTQDHYRQDRPRGRVWRNEPFDACRGRCARSTGERAWID